MNFTLEQCEKISTLLKRKNIKQETKKDIAILLLNTLSDINCSKCIYYDIIPSFVYCTVNKCNITKEICPDYDLLKGRIQNCPYQKYEDESKCIIDRKNNYMIK